ncbi:MAG: DUF222 domain-containing protein [Myxococcota bacterium]
MGFTREESSCAEGLSARQIEAEIAALAARIDAATHRMLVLIRRFDESGEWGRQGHRSCAAWLSWRTGLGPGAAREHVRVAKALAELPKVDAALARGDISFSKVRAITRVATPEREETLLRLARFSTAQQLERICRGVRQVERSTEDDGTPKKPSGPERFVVQRCMPDGTVEVVARLQPDEARAVVEAIDRVRKARAEEQAPVSEAVPQVEGASAETPPPSKPAPRKAWPDRADALVELAGRVLAGDLDAKGDGAPRPGGERAEVTVAFTRDALGTGYAAKLEDGTHVSAETFRRIACDAALVPHLEDEAGRTLDVGRKTRSIPPSIRRALRQRQPTCAFPGCGHTRFLDAHHLTHWIDGGETKISNLVHLCRLHHRLIHEDGFTLTLDDQGRPLFRTPAGRPILPTPPRPRFRGNATDDKLDDIGRRAHIPIDPWVRYPEWQGDRPDYNWCVASVVR